MSFLSVSGSLYQNLSLQDLIVITRFTTTLYSYLKSSLSQQNLLTTIKQDKFPLSSIEVTTSKINSQQHFELKLRSVLPRVQVCVGTAAKTPQLEGPEWNYLGSKNSTQGSSWGSRGKTLNPTSPLVHFVVCDKKSTAYTKWNIIGRSLLISIGYCLCVNQ